MVKGEGNEGEKVGSVADEAILVNLTLLDFEQILVAMAIQPGDTLVEGDGAGIGEIVVIVQFGGAFNADRFKTNPRA